MPVVMCPSLFRNGVFTVRIYSSECRVPLGVIPHRRPPLPLILIGVECTKFHHSAKLRHRRAAGPAHRENGMSRVPSPFSLAANLLGPTRGDAYRPMVAIPLPDSPPVAAPRSGGRTTAPQLRDSEQKCRRTTSSRPRAGRSAMMEQVS